MEEEAKELAGHAVDEDEVRREFLFTVVLTVGVLLGVTLLLTCQWLQSRWNYSEDRKLLQLSSTSCELSEYSSEQFNTTLLP